MLVECSYQQNAAASQKIVQLFYSQFRLLEVKCGILCVGCFFHAETEKKCELRSIFVEGCKKHAAFVCFSFPTFF